VIKNKEKTMSPQPSAPRKPPIYRSLYAQVIAP
jgi:hypothetical protein